MDNTDILQLINDQEHETLLEYLNSKITDEHQKLFTKNFYMAFFKKDEEYPIYINEDAIKWLGYTRKSTIKSLIQKHLVNEKDYILQQALQNPLGGRPSDDIYMTIDAFKQLGMLAGTEQGKQIRMYYIELEKHLTNYCMIQAMNKLKENQDKIKALEDECETLRNTSDGTPIVYIYDTDARAFNTDLKTIKIGATEQYHKRSKPFKCVTPHGRMVFSEGVAHVNLKSAEKWIHTVLSPYHVGNEMFKMDIEFAKIIITIILAAPLLANISDKNEKMSIGLKLVTLLNSLLKKEIVNNDILKYNVYTQTDDTLLLPSPVKDYTKFDEFIGECCILNEHAQVSSTDIVGKYRIWSQSAEKETFHDILDYLKIKFKPCRLRCQNKDTIINGFGGVQLKDLTLTLSCAPSEAERFIYATFNYSPSGKVLMTDVIKEFERWKPDCTPEDVKNMKKYLKYNEHVLVSNLWTETGHGQGYYGLVFKHMENYHRKSSSTAKKIEKRDKDNNFIKAYASIAKAAEENDLSATKLSRMIKNNIKQEDGSYYVVI
jgi:phage anti-repressor protein